ncbi:MAG: alpha/beta fold hydrolase [Janthinobacterium lividum]
MLTLIVAGFASLRAQEAVNPEAPIQSTFQSNGLQLRYSVLGHGTPVLLLAGGPGLDAGYMMPLARIVAREHTAIVLDQRGTDGSMPKVVNAETVNLNLYLADYEALRRKLGYVRWTVLGHSFGSYFAMNYAIRYPDAVYRMLLTGTVPPTWEMASHFQETLLSRLTAEQRLQYEAFNKAEEKATDDASKDRLDTAAGDIIANSAYFFDQQKAAAFSASSPESEAHVRTGDLLFREAKNYDLRSPLAKVQIPVLILQGRQDPLDLGMAGATRDAISTAKLVVVERSGHFGWLEQPEFYNKALLEFLR